MAISRKFHIYVRTKCQYISKVKFHERDQNYYKRYGKTFGFNSSPTARPMKYFRNSSVSTIQEMLYEPSANMLMISDPEDIKAILVKDFDKFAERRVVNDGSIFSKGLLNLNGEKWNAVRNVITPSFSAAKMKYMIDCLINCSEELAECLVEKAKTTKEFDAKRQLNKLTKSLYSETCAKLVFYIIYGAYTLDVIAGTAFRTNVNTLKNPDNEFAQYSKQLFALSISWRILFVFLFPKWATKLGIRFIKPEVTNYFINVVRKIIKLRRNEEVRSIHFIFIHSTYIDRDKRNLEIPQYSMEENKKSPDFLSILKGSMEEGAFDDSKPKKPEIESSDEVWKKESKKFMTEDLVVAQCVLFFGAGYETTASTLSMVSYNLAIYPECQNKLVKEIDIATEKHGKLTYDAISEMPYLKAVVKETLRLYSPAARLERKCTENYQLGSIFLKKGTLVGVPTYSIHHDAEYWPDPETFDPERFMGDPSDINPYTYLPFGIGRRNCVAMRFAEMEIKVAIAVLLSKVRLFKLPTTPVSQHLISGEQARNLDSKNIHVIPGWRFCRSCFKKIDDIIKHIEENHTKDPSFDPEVAGSSKSGFLQSALDESLDALNESPVRLHGIPPHQRASKAKSKLKKVVSKLEKQVSDVYHVDVELNPSSIPCSTDIAFKATDLKNLTVAMKEKLKDTDYTKKVQILTPTPESWSRTYAASYFGVSEYLIRKSRQLKKDKGILALPSKTTGKEVSKETIDLVKSHYLDDEYTRQMPGKKDYYKERNPNTKIGFSKFCSLRPNWCIVAGSSGTHSVCVCTYHQNTILLLSAIKWEVTYKDLIAMVVCDPLSNECMIHRCKQCPGTDALKAFLDDQLKDMDLDEEISFDQWESVDRTALYTRTVSVEDYNDRVVASIKWQV
ncbi:Cytochrome P450 9e2 [Nymphon striatum]|nr:Cytochrome P450 9e2 [Nymphon striatum]